MDDALTLADIGEKVLVERIRDAVPPPGQGAVGIGDDAATAAVGAGEVAVLSTDRVPSDLIALRLGLMDHDTLGRYLVEVNVSDVAAMGATPKAVLLNLAFPRTQLVAEVESLVTSASRRAREHGADLIGGDTKYSETAQYVGIAMGTAKPEALVQRSGASPGDRILVTGPVGAFGAALAYFMREDKSRGLAAHWEQQLLGKFLRPVARTDLSMILARNCTSAIDISDGLSQSATELARASRCDLRIDSRLIPIHPAAIEVATFLGLDVVKLATGVGLDLELLCTARSGSSMPGTDIGAVERTSEPDGALILDGQRMSGATSGFEHLVKDAAEYVL